MGRALVFRTHPEIGQNEADPNGMRRKLEVGTGLLYWPKRGRTLRQSLR